MGAYSHLYIGPYLVVPQPVEPVSRDGCQNPGTCTQDPERVEGYCATCGIKLSGRFTPSTRVINRVYDVLEPFEDSFFILPRDGQAYLFSNQRIRDVPNEIYVPSVDFLEIDIRGRDQKKEMETFLSLYEKEVALLSKTFPDFRKEWGAVLYMY